ncbi:hypothetical protein NC651_000871 [Populus alba x Populus x berolinensis]|nr:hypothetical protein NC651_000871 [Populus alba x Populus x berolinensis]
MVHRMKCYCVPTSVVEEINRTFFIDNQSACPDDLAEFVAIQCFDPSKSDNVNIEDGLSRRQRRHCLNAKDAVELNKCGEGRVTEITKGRLYLNQNPLRSSLNAIILFHVSLALAILNSSPFTVLKHIIVGILFGWRINFGGCSLPHIIEPKEKGKRYASLSSRKDCHFHSSLYEELLQVLVTNRTMESYWLLLYGHMPKRNPFSSYLLNQSGLISQVISLLGYTREKTPVQKEAVDSKLHLSGGLESAHFNSINLPCGLTIAPIPPPVYPVGYKVDRLCAFSVAVKVTS